MEMKICPYCSGKVYSSSFREDWKCPYCDKLVKVDEGQNSKNNKTEED